MAIKVTKMVKYAKGLYHKINAKKCTIYRVS